MVSDGDLAERMIFGVSDKAAALRSQVRQLAALDEPVLIEGAPGTGVDKIADVIHRMSSRGIGPFVKVSAAALTPEQLRRIGDEAKDGTLYIDQVSVLPPETQFELMGRLDEGVDFRVVAGTYARADSNGLSADLHYRLEALKIRIPALKERPEDIPELFRRYVEQASAQTGVAAPVITDEVIADLMARDWLGNSRALMNAATRFVLGLGAEGTEDEEGLAEKMARVERALLIEGLRRHGGNASLTADHFKLPRKTLYDKFGKHGIKPKDFR